MPTATRRSLPVSLIAGLVTAVLIGCGPGPSPIASPPTASPAATAIATPAPSVDAAAVYAGIARQVEQIRGLQPKGDVTPALIDGAQLRANLTATFDKDNPPATVRQTEVLYQLLGLLPAGTSLRTAELDLLSGQVAGYYAPDRKQLFVVSRAGGIGPTQEVTYAHEFTHQLQDQNFDLTKVQDTATDQSDRGLARLSLIEGDAVSVQSAWTTANLTSADLARLIADASDPAILASLEKAPPILRVLSLVPYTAGQGFVTALQSSGGEAAVDAGFGSPPDSTSQVLHPDLYRAGTKPVAVSLPTDLAAALGPGWTSLGQDTLGELFIRSWLQADGVPLQNATSAAAGWAGDRLELFAGPKGQLALAMVIRWSTEPDVVEFGTGWNTVMPSVSFASAYDATLASNGVAITIAPAGEQAEALILALRR